MKRILYVLLMAASCTPILLAAELDCKKLHEEIEKDIDQDNYCQSDNDCSALNLGGPYIAFGCYHFVNREVDQKKIFRKINSYTEGQCTSMIDRCASAPEPKCISNKCTA